MIVGIIYFENTEHSVNVGSFLTVTPALQEPLPGWVDNLNGPTGILAAGGKGVLRSVLCNAKYNAEAVPVDFAINAVIAIAWKTAITNQK